MTGVCRACGQDLPRPEPVPCPQQLRGRLCRACGHLGTAHTPDGVCLTCVVEASTARTREETRA